MRNRCLLLAIVCKVAVAIHLPSGRTESLLGSRARSKDHAGESSRASGHQALQVLGDHTAFLNLSNFRERLHSRADAAGKEESDDPAKKDKDKKDKGASLLQESDDPAKKDKDKKDKGASLLLESDDPAKKDKDEKDNGASLSQDKRVTGKKTRLAQMLTGKGNAKASKKETKVTSPVQKLDRIDAGANISDTALQQVLPGTGTSELHVAKAEAAKAAAVPVSEAAAVSVSEVKAVPVSETAAARQSMRQPICKTFSCKVVRFILANLIVLTVMVVVVLANLQASRVSRRYTDYLGARKQKHVSFQEPEVDASDGPPVDDRGQDVPSEGPSKQAT